MNKTINKLILLGVIAFVFGFTNLAYATDTYVVQATCTSCNGYGPVQNQLSQAAQAAQDIANRAAQNANQSPIYTNVYSNPTQYQYPVNNNVYNNPTQYQYPVNNNAVNYGNSNTGYYDPNFGTNNPTVNNANPGVSYVPTTTHTLAVATTKKKTVVVQPPVVPTPTIPVQNNVEPQPMVQPQTVSNDNNGLSALSWFGAPGFLPNTIFEWILTIFLILVLIILIRQFRPQPVHEAHPTAVHH